MSERDVQELNAHFCTKSTVKQEVYQKTLGCFNALKSEAGNAIESLLTCKEKEGHNLDIVYADRGTYEAEMRFSGDALTLQMHTNVFAFPKEHFIHQQEDVKQDADNGYVGMILIYNFLADSIRFNRQTDIGYLLGRIFINRKGQFFVDGKRQFSFLYPNFSEQLFDANFAQQVIQKSMKQAIDFDLYVPPFDEVREVSLYQKNVQQGNTAIKTGKRVGFVYDGMED